MKTKIINASGMMSKLGVSRAPDTVTQKVASALQNFYVMDELKAKIGQEIATTLGFEKGIVVNSAASGIVLSTAAVIIRGDKKKILDHFQIKASQIIIPQGHLINFNAPLSYGLKMAGATIVPVGAQNHCPFADIEKAINPQTKAVFLVKSHYCADYKIPSLKEIYALCQKHNIPLIIDAAAETNFKQYAPVADLVIGSGAKHFRGPTSGFVVGKGQWINQLFLIEPTMGRYMKVGKEALVGLREAICHFQKLTLQINVEAFCQKLNTFPWLKAKIVVDKTRPEIKRVQTLVKTKDINLFIQLLEKKPVQIFTRNYQKKDNIIVFDTRWLTLVEENDIIIKLEEINQNHVEIIQK